MDQQVRRKDGKEQVAFIKLVVFGFAALTVIYWSVSLYARSVHREKLENDFDTANAGTADAGARDAFVAKGMQAYQSSLRPKLIGLVYIIPVVAVAVTIYLINMT